MKWDNGVYNMAPIAPEEISDRMNDRTDPATVSVLD